MESPSRVAERAGSRGIEADLFATPEASRDLLRLNAFNRATREMREAVIALSITAVKTAGLDLVSSGLVVSWSAIYRPLILG